MTDSIDPPQAPEKSNLKLVITALSVVLLMVLAALFRDQVRSVIQTFQDWAEQAGFLGGVAYAAVYATATVAFIPGWFLTVGAGVVYGVIIGSIIVSVGSTVGATLAFLLARSFLRDAVASKVEGNKSFRSIDEAIAESGWKIVFLIRLSPIFPFNLLNYALGLTKIPAWHYVLASWIGMMPGTVMYVYLGAIGHALAGQQERTMGQNVLFAVGLVATILVTILITRIARKALTREVPVEAPAQ